MSTEGKVLVVDDSKTSRLFIIRSLEMAGLTGREFIEAANGVEALDILKTNSAIQYMVTDINMPQKCGMTLIREIRDQKISAMLNIIVISSTQNEVRDAELKALGAFAVLKKPIQIPALMTAISQMKQGA